MDRQREARDDLKQSSGAQMVLCFKTGFTLAIN